MCVNVKFESSHCSRVKFTFMWRFGKRLYFIRATVLTWYGECHVGNEHIPDDVTFLCSRLNTTACESLANTPGTKRLLPELGVRWRMNKLNMQKKRKRGVTQSGTRNDGGEELLSVESGWNKYCNRSSHASLCIPASLNLSLLGFFPFNFSPSRCFSGRPAFGST